MLEKGCYSFLQDLLPSFTQNEISNLDNKISIVQNALDEKKKTFSVLQKELNHLNKEPSIVELVSKRDNLNSTCSKLTDQYKSLKKVRSKQDKVDDEEKNNAASIMKLKSEFRTLEKEKIKRRRIYKDALESILEGWPKSKKELFDDIGIDEE